MFPIVQVFFPQTPVTLTQAPAQQQIWFVTLKWNAKLAYFLQWKSSTEWLQTIYVRKNPNYQTKQDPQNEQL